MSNCAECDSPATSTGLCVGCNRWEDERLARLQDADDLCERGGDPHDVEIEDRWSDGGDDDRE